MGCESWLGRLSSNIQKKCCIGTGSSREVVELAWLGGSTLEEAVALLSEQVVERSDWQDPFQLFQ